MPCSINQRIVGAWQRRIYQRLHAQKSPFAALPVFVGRVQFIVGQGSQIRGAYFQPSVAFMVALPLRMLCSNFMPCSINQRIVGAWQRRIYQRLHAQQSHLAALPVFVGQVQFIVGQGSQIRARISNSASHSWSPCPPFWYAGKTKTLPLEGSSGRVCLYKQPLDGCDSRESFDG